MKERVLIVGLVCAFVLTFFSSCEKEKRECPDATEKTIAVSGFNKIEAGESFKIDIQKAANFSLKASGCSDDLEDLLLTVDDNNILHIRYKDFRRSRYQVKMTITLPYLVAVNLSGVAKANIDGFAGQSSSIRTVLSGNSEAILNGTGINTSIELSGTSRLTLKGSTLSLYGNISGDARLFSYELSATEVDIATSGTAKGYVYPQQEFYVIASGESRVYYKGNPATKQIETDGTAKVIKE